MPELSGHVRTRKLVGVAPFAPLTGQLRGKSAKGSGGVLVVRSDLSDGVHPGSDAPGSAIASCPDVVTGVGVVPRHPFEVDAPRYQSARAMKAA